MPLLHASSPVTRRHSVFPRGSGLLLDGGAIIATDEDPSVAGHEGSNQSPFHSPEDVAPAPGDSISTTSTSSPTSQSTQSSSTIGSDSTTPVSSTSASSTSIDATTSTVLATSATTTPSAIDATPPIQTTQNASSEHPLSFWIGIACAGLVVVAVCLALFYFWRRIRSPQRRGRDEWLPAPEESGGAWWEPAFDRNVGEPKTHRQSQLSKRPTFLSRFRSIRDPQPCPISVTAPRSVTEAELGFKHGPYPTARALSVSPATSIDRDHLMVANLIEGDILSSGDEGSRQPTIIPGTGLSPNVGTPREMQEEMKPRYLGLQDGGLRVPWAAPPPAPPLALQPARQDGVNKWMARLRDPSRVVQHIDMPEPQTSGPSHPETQAPTTSHAEGAGWTWTNTIRTNITAAFGAFTGTGTGQKENSGPSRSSSRSSSLFGPRPPAYSRGPSFKMEPMDHNARKDILFDFTDIELGPPGNNDGAHVLKSPCSSTHYPNPFDMVAPASTYSSHLIKHPSPALSKDAFDTTPQLRSRNSAPRKMPRGHSTSHSRRSSRVRRDYYQSGSDSDSIPPVPALPPHVSPAPHTTVAATPRPSLLPRRSSVSIVSMSVGSDMSRASSFSTIGRVGKLTEKEEKARRALRTRRKKSIGVKFEWE